MMCGRLLKYGYRRSYGGFNRHFNNQADPAGEEVSEETAATLPESGLSEANSAYWRKFRTKTLCFGRE